MRVGCPSRGRRAGRRAPRCVRRRGADGWRREGSACLPSRGSICACRVLVPEPRNGAFPVFAPPLAAANVAVRRSVLAAGPVHRLSPSLLDGASFLIHARSIRFTSPSHPLRLLPIRCGQRARAGVAAPFAGRRAQAGGHRHQDGSVRLASWIAVGRLSWGRTLGNPVPTCHPHRPHPVLFPRRPNHPAPWFHQENPPHAAPRPRPSATAAA